MSVTGAGIVGVPAFCKLAEVIVVVPLGLVLIPVSVSYEYPDFDFNVAILFTWLVNIIYDPQFLNALTEDLDKLLKSQQNCPASEKPVTA